MESEDGKRFDEVNTEIAPVGEEEEQEEGKHEEEDDEEEEEVKPVPIDTLKDNDERPKAHEAGQSEADTAPGAFDAGMEEVEEDVSASSSRQPSPRVQEEGEGQGEDGEAAEDGITIAPRTPVLDQDPLRALASSPPGTTAPMSPSSTHTPIPTAQPSEATSYATHMKLTMWIADVVMMMAGEESSERREDCPRAADARNQCWRPMTWRD